MLLAATEKTLQIGRKICTHLAGCGSGLARLQFVVLVDIGLFQALQFFHRLGQTRGCHAPSTDRGAHQVNCLIAGCQPLSKQKTVQRPKQQAFGATGRAWNHPNVLRLQAVCFQMLQGLGASVNGQGFHVQGWRKVFRWPLRPIVNMHSTPQR